MREGLPAVFAAGPEIGSRVDVEGLKHRDIPTGSPAGSRPVLDLCGPRAAVANLARTASTKPGRYGIRVDAVAPRAIEAGQPREFEPPSALDRRGTAEEGAKVIRFLAGDQASFVTGQSLSVHGGGLP